MTRLLRSLVFATALVAGVAGCSTAPEDSRIGVVTPDRTQFPPTADFMDHRCGSLDCHGSPQRNLVMWGCEGQRLDPGDVPGCRAQGGKNTTDAEYDETYRSLVGLEPAVMSAVVAGHGTHPELLTFIRKARGAESHKGGQLVTPGDDQDTCMVSWLGGATNADACKRAIMSTP